MTTVSVDWRKKLLADVEEQRRGRDPAAVDSLALSNSLVDPTVLAPFTNLRSLVCAADSNFCRMTSLDGFPVLSKLTNLELRDHLIAEVPENFASSFPELTDLMLENNKFYSVDVLAPLAKCTKLRKIFLGDNPVCKDADYREQVFKLLPQVAFVDGIDRAGARGEDSEDDGDEEEGEEDEEVEELESDTSEEECDEEMEAPQDAEGTRKRKREDGDDRPQEP
eukprot:TRINITY_DN13557_c0_g1_i1.p3 TRINITY_DN13557_c0_g1~~TRINITY_DN13557_c0_g1_i1.p3  ORF type:complete len:223 (+),score=78.32 TRINITY_DN13557_c0_g1_i1:80-748(+)